MDPSASGARLFRKKHDGVGNATERADQSFADDARGEDLDGRLPHHHRSKGEMKKFCPIVTCCCWTMVAMMTILLTVIIATTNAVFIVMSWSVDVVVSYWLETLASRRRRRLRLRMPSPTSLPSLHLLAPAPF